MVGFRRDWFIQINTMQREMERLLEHFASSKPPMVQFSPQVWEPAIDVYETDEEIVVVAELAGVREENIEIVVDRNTLVIRGDRNTALPSGQRICHQLEIASGPFLRNITLPTPVEPEQTRASYQDGFVRINLPKVRAERTRTVKVRVV